MALATFPWSGDGTADTHDSPLLGVKGHWTTGRVAAAVDADPISFSMIAFWP
jgi:hypothetical protein